MPVKIANPFTTQTPIGQALGNAVLAYGSNVATPEERAKTNYLGSEAAINQQKLSAPDLVRQAITARYANSQNGAQFTPEQRQSSLADLGYAAAAAGKLDQLGDLDRVTTYGAANPANTGMRDSSYLGAGGDYKNTETGFATGQTNDLKKTGMNNTTEIMKANIMADAATKREQMVIDAANARADQKASQQTAKPLPPQALKLQQENIDGLTIADNLQSDLTNAKTKLDNGQLSLGPVENLVNQGRNAVGASDPESRNFGEFRNTLEKLRNDSLRLNKGTQTEGDAERAWNELLTNLNDPELVKQRLGSIIDYNQRAASQHELNVHNIRAEYGKDDIDLSQYKMPGVIMNPQPPAAGGNTGVAPSTGAPKIKSITRLQ